MKTSRILVAVAALTTTAGTASAQAPVAPAPTPAATAPLPPPTPTGPAGTPAITPAPAPAPAPYPYPAPPYGYPPPYAYPPGYGYPPAPGAAPGAPPYPAAPGAPSYPYPAYPGYPGYPPPPAAPAAPPPAPPPAGKWRLGGALVLVPQGQLKYDLRYRGESLLAHDRGIQTTGGIALFGEWDGVRYLHLGFAFQALPSIEWQSSSVGSSATPFTGTARAFDFLPQIGVRYDTSPRLRVLAYAAPGYSLLATSGMADVFAESGTAHGFVLQATGGILYAIGGSAFFSVRGSYQWGFHNDKVSSSTTGESADVRFRLRFAALQGSFGYWF